MKMHENRWNYSPHSLPLPLILPLYMLVITPILFWSWVGSIVSKPASIASSWVSASSWLIGSSVFWANLCQNGYGLRNAKMATCIAIWLGLSLGVTEMVGGRGAMGLCMDLDYSILLMGFDYAICIIGMGKSISNTICNSIGKFNRQFNRQYNSQYNQQLYQTN